MNTLQKIFFLASPKEEHSVRFSETVEDIECSPIEKSDEDIDASLPSLEDQVAAAVVRFSQETTTDQTRSRNDSPQISKRTEPRRQRRLSLQGLRSGISTFLKDEGGENENFKNRKALKGVGLNLGDTHEEDDPMDVISALEESHSSSTGGTSATPRPHTARERRLSIQKSFLVNDIKIQEAIENTRGKFANESSYYSEAISLWSESSEYSPSVRSLVFSTFPNGIVPSPTVGDANAVSTTQRSLSGSPSVSSASPENTKIQQKKSRRRSIQRECIGLYTFTLADEETKSTDRDRLVFSDFFRHDEYTTTASSGSSSGENSGHRSIKRTRRSSMGSIGSMGSSQMFQAHRRNSILNLFGHSASGLSESTILNTGSISPGQVREIRSALGITLDSQDGSGSGIKPGTAALEDGDGDPWNLDLGPSGSFTAAFNASLQPLRSIPVSISISTPTPPPIISEPEPFKKLSSLYIHTEGTDENSFPRRNLVDFEVRQDKSLVTEEKARAKGVVSHSSTESSNSEASDGKWFGVIHLKQRLLRYERGPQGSRPDTMTIGPCPSDSICRDLCASLAPPVWHSKVVQRLCRLCQHKFNFFRKAHHCRNCGSVVCSYCSDRLWSGSMLPPTYHAGEKCVRVCHSCHYLAERFICALKDGDLSLCLRVFGSGNINLHTPYRVYRSGAYPLHVAASGGNVEILRWLLEEKRCSVYDSATGEPLLTRGGLSVLAVAACQGSEDAVRFLIDNRHCRVSDLTDPILLQRLLHIVLRAPGHLPPLCNSALYTGILSDDLLFGSFSRKLKILRDGLSQDSGTDSSTCISSFSSLPHNCLTTATLSTKALLSKSNACLCARAIVLVEDWLSALLTLPDHRGNVSATLKDLDGGGSEVQGQNGGSRPTPMDLGHGVNFDQLISVPRFGSSLFT